LEERQLNVTQLDVFSRLMMDRIIFLGTEVNDYTANVLQAQMLYLDSVDSAKDISIYINSPGGSVYAGLGIYDTMQFINSDVRTICTGMAASMAAVLLVAGKEGKRSALPHSRIMIHDPAFSGGSYAGKKPNEIEEVLKDLRYTQETLCKLLAERTGQPLEVIYENTKKDTYFNAEEAIEFGLATGIVTIPEALQPTEGGNE